MFAVLGEDSKKVWNVKIMGDTLTVPPIILQVEYFLLLPNIAPIVANGIVAIFVR